MEITQTLIFTILCFFALSLGSASGAANWVWAKGNLHIFDFGQLTLDNVERVEVVRGPGSVLYGSDAVSGVIQIFTRTGAKESRSSLEVGGGTYGTRRLSAETSSHAGVWGWGLGGARDQTDGILPFNNQFRNSTWTGNVRASGSQGDLGTSIRYTDYTYHYPTNSAGEVVDSNAYAAERRTVLNVDGGWKATAWLELRLREARDEARPKTRDLPDFAADSNSFVADDHVTRTVTEGRAVANIHGRHMLTFALEHARDHEVSTSTSTSSFGPFYDSLTATRTNTAASAQLIGNLGRRATYALGLRRDDNSKFGVFTTGRAAFALAIAQGTRIRTSWGNAFKAPSFFENFATGFVVGNPRLNPERTNSLELGIEKIAPDRRYTVGATAFLQRFHDLIQYVSVVAPGQPNYANLAGASADGVEFETAWRLAPELTARGSYTLLRTRVTNAGVDSGPSASFVKGDRLLRRPTHLASLRMTEVTSSKRTFELQLTYTGSRDDRDFSTFPATPVVMKAFARIDASWQQPLTRSAEDDGPVLITRVENALNTNYQQTLGFRAPGRTLYIGIRLGN